MAKKTKKAPRARRAAEIIVKVQQAPAALVPTTTDVSEPIMVDNKLSIPKTWVSEKQVMQMVQATPRQHVYRRKGKGGQAFEYVTGQYVTKVLNYVFGWNWDFEVQSHGVEGGMIWVLGRLTVKDGKGNSITKTQFGRAEVKKLKTGGNLDFGNDLKAATTDALKKCASMFGIASDIYGKTEYKEEAGVDVREEPAQPHPNPDAPVPKPVAMRPGQVAGPDGRPTFTCFECTAPISEQVAEYSLRLYGQRYCREDQKGRNPVKR